jgi:tetratricopeptide (TPR) repeat protein
MNAEVLRTEMLEMLAEIRSAGRGVSRTDLGRILDRRLPSLVVSQDAFEGVSMSDAFRIRLGEAVSDACAVARERVEAQIVDGSAMPRRLPTRTRTLGWSLAAAAVLLMGMWLFSILAPRGQIVAPKVTPPVAGPEKPIVPRPERKTPGPTVQIEPGTRRRSVKEPFKAVPKRDPGKVAVNKPPAIGEITSIEGEPILFEPGDENPRIARGKTALVAGTRFETGDMDRVEFKLQDGSVLRLAFNTALVHRGNGKDATARDFELLRGSVYAIVAPTTDREKFTIETPVATARVWATEFILELVTTRARDSLESKLSANLQVKSGTVQFYNDFGDVKANAWEESTAVDGAGPTTPRRIKKLREQIFTYDAGHTHLTEYTYRLGAHEARARLVTGERGPSVPRLPAMLARLLEEATRPALSGELDTSIARLRKLASDAPHAAVLNNLGIAHELKDDMEAAIRSYQAATRLDPGQPLYRYNLGFALQRIGNLPRSVEELEEAVRLAPGYEMAIKELAHDYDLLERYDEALDVVEAGLRRNPKSAILWMSKSTVLFDGGRHDEAEKGYKHTIELDPTNANAWYQLGYALRFQGKDAESERAFERSLEIAPRDVASLTAVAGIRRKQNLFKEAEELYKSALAIDPDNVGAHADLAWLYENIDRSPEAESHYRKAIKLDPNAAYLHNNLALLLYHNFKGRVKEAEKSFRRAIALDPTHVNFHRGLAEAVASLGRRKEAEAHYRIAVDLEPGNFLSYKYFADFYLQSGRPAKAAALYLEGVRANPKSSNFLTMAGWYLITIHYWEESVEVHRKLVALLPPGHDAIHANTYLAYALIHTGKFREAKSLVDQVLTDNPDDTECASHRATILALTGGDLDEALKWAKRGASEPQPYGIRWHALGLVHFKRGEFDPAIEALEKAVKSFGGIYLAADALVLLGQVYEAKRDVPAAIDAYRRAQKIESGNKPAAEALKRLGG